MITLNNFTEHNKYVGLPDPLNEDVDLGRYEVHHNFLVRKMLYA